MGSNHHQLTCSSAGHPSLSSPMWSAGCILCSRHCSNPVRGDVVTAASTSPSHDSGDPGSSCRPDGKSDRARRDAQGCDASFRSPCLAHEVSLCSHDLFPEKSSPGGLHPVLRSRMHPKRLGKTLKVRSGRPSQLKRMDRDLHSALTNGQGGFQLTGVRFDTNRHPHELRDQNRKRVCHEEDETSLILVDQDRCDIGPELHPIEPTNRSLNKSVIHHRGEDISRRGLVPHCPSALKIKPPRWRRVSQDEVRGNRGHVDESELNSVLILVKSRTRLLVSFHVVRGGSMVVSHLQLTKKKSTRWPYFVFHASTSLRSSGT